MTSVVNLGVILSNLSKLSVGLGMHMPIAARAKRGAKKRPSSKAGSVFGFSVAKDRLQSLVSGLPEGDWVTVITRRPISEPKLRAARPHRIDLSDFSEDTLSALVDEGGSIAIDADTNCIGSAAFEPDARARTMLRGVEIAESDLEAAGGAYDLNQVKRFLHGLSRQRIERRVKEGTLLAVPGPSNRRRYPTVQFNSDGTTVQGLKAVREALDFESPWAILNYLIQPDERLSNKRPIDVLRQGNIGLVLESARRVGLQGA